jgi:hypothetical protein
MTDTKAHRQSVNGKYRDETVKAIKLIRQNFGTIRRFCLVNKIDEETFRATLLKLKRHRGINRTSPTPESMLDKIYKLLNIKKW